MKYLFLSLLLISLNAKAMRLVIQYQIDESEAKIVADVMMKKYFLPKERIVIKKVKNCEASEDFSLEWCLKHYGDLQEIPKKNNSLIKTAILVFRRIQNE